jgi:hypothetical protein
VVPYFVQTGAGAAKGHGDAGALCGDGGLDCGGGVGKTALKAGGDACMIEIHLE